MSRKEKTRKEGCLICKQSCLGYQQHLWRKVCGCGCSWADHTPSCDAEDDQRMGRLLADSPCSHLTTKVKGGGGLRVYKRNRMIVTNPDATRKDPTFETTTYTWCPAGVSQTLALQYMTLFPEALGAQWGEEGSLARRRRLQDQLPPYDVDPMLCKGLLSDQEISTMLLFVRGYKQEVLGVGEVALAGGADTLVEAATQRGAKEAKEKESSDGMAEETQHVCAGCGEGVAADSPAVFAERAGYHSNLWHPTCFCCSECCQGLVDLVYFWSNDKLLCGRHFCQTKWPRCSGCDELIFSPSFRTGSDGRTFHHHHYCCWRCGTDLDTPCAC
ncbi:LIM and cysteine-rich domains protein 1 [Gadus morhua]|uniref:LIM and cysteine-rich domains protein 1 n=1 Tax=Gadus morhua TaxID=8049 RepID=UPI0011B4E41C|nr:LIM and cysteine-rich domains protein 1-like [Gadus morhua]